MDTRDLLIHVNYTAAPIPTRELDWAAYVDGDEERGSCMGATPWEALRDLADRLEDDAETREIRERFRECPACNHPLCLCHTLRSTRGVREHADVHLESGQRRMRIESLSTLATANAMTILACESLLEHS